MKEAWHNSPEQLVKIISKLKIVDQIFDGTLLLEFILITIPEVKLDIVYQLVHIGQHEDFLKTHL